MSSSSNKKLIASRLDGATESVWYLLGGNIPHSLVLKVNFYLFFWVEFIQRALDYKPVNLGQGFPDFPPPDCERKALTEAVTGPNFGLNQYTRGFVCIFH